MLFHAVTCHLSVETLLIASDKCPDLYWKTGAHKLYICSKPVALPDLYFYCSQRRFIVSILLPIVSFSNHRPRLERYGLALYLEEKGFFFSDNREKHRSGLVTKETWLCMRMYT